MEATIWHNPACSTSRKVLGWLRDAGIEPTIVEYLKHPPDRAAITAMLAKAGMTPRALLRRKAPAYAAQGLDNPALTDAQILDAMLAEPVLIERPVVITSKGARLCRPPELVHEII